MLCLIRALDEEAPWGMWGSNSCAHWLNWRCGIGLNAARVTAATGAAGLMERNRARGLDIDASTGASRWDGLPMDYSTAIYALLERDGRLYSFWWNRGESESGPDRGPHSSRSSSDGGRDRSP